MRSRRLSIIAPGLVGGLVLALAFPPWSAPFLAPLGVATLTLTAGDHGVRRGLVAGTTFGLAFFGVTLWWLAESIAPAAWLALTMTQAAWLGGAGVGLVLVRRLPGWPLWAACTWTAVESARSAVPWGGVPWGRLGYTALDSPWEGFLSTVGVTGASTLVALLGTSTAAAVLAVRDHRPLLQLSRPVSAAGALVAFAAVVAAGVGQPSPVTVGAPVVRVAVVQGGVPGDSTDVAAHHRAVTASHLAETRELALTFDADSPPDLVLWPENALAVDPTRDDAARRALTDAVAVAGVPVLAGAIVDDSDPSFARNQGIVWTSAGPAERYTKQHLVPFGEYVPLRPLADRISARVAELGRDMVPGAPGPPLHVGDLRLADALCFDVAYDDVIRSQVDQGAELVVVQTSNAMFQGTAQPEQQWAITRARAVEVGRSIVVASINGISGAIGPDGNVMARLPHLQTASAVLEVPRLTSTTLATHLGPWPGRLVWLAATVALVIALRPAGSRP